MNCAELAEQLTEFLEGELTADAELQALEHLATCGRCEMVFNQTRQTIGLVNRHGSETLAPNRREEILNSLLTKLHSQQNPG